LCVTYTHRAFGFFQSHMLKSKCFISWLRMKVCLV
jgi:hypothetical protein